MFTGIIERSVPLTDTQRTPAGMRLTLANVWPGELRHGESIAINGVCLTVADHSSEQVHFDIIPETLAKTHLGQLQVGDLVHAERALRFGDRLDGHVVQGHVDGTAAVVSNGAKGDDWRLRVKVPPALAKYLIPKGSVTLDGTSLTIAALAEKWFEVALIPTTLQITQLGKRPSGWPLNVECDMMVKTIVAVVERQQQLAHVPMRDRF